MFDRIHITGASGSGTTTLGEALARRMDCVHLETDNYYWLPTDPPFQIKREMPKRLRLLREALEPREKWVLAGAIGEWGEPLVALFDCVVFLDVPTEIRLDRLRRRETERYGKADPAFLEWASAYDAGTLPGRNRQRHEAWLAALRCPVVRIEGDRPVEEIVNLLTREC